MGDGVGRPTRAAPSGGGAGAPDSRYTPAMRHLSLAVLLLAVGCYPNSYKKGDDEPLFDAGDDTDAPFDDTDPDTAADTATDTDADTDTDTDPGPCRVRSSPSTVNFGVAEVGHSVSAYVVLTNSGLLPCTITGVELEESNDLALIQSFPSGLVLENGDEARMTLTYGPLEPGMLVDTLHVYSDDATRPDLSIGVTGSCEG